MHARTSTLLTVGLALLPSIGLHAMYAVVDVEKVPLARLLQNLGDQVQASPPTGWHSLKPGPRRARRGRAGLPRR